MLDVGVHGDLVVAGLVPRNPNLDTIHSPHHFHEFLVEVIADIVENDGAECSAAGIGPDDCRQ